MTDTDMKSRMENQFVSYKSLLCKHGLSWITMDNKKAAFQHVLTAIRLASLRSPLGSDLEHAHTKLCKELERFYETNHPVVRVATAS